MVPIFLFIFIFSLYFTIQTALRENLSTGSFIRFHSHENKFKPIRFEGEKIVHLDFKGAPPKVKYLKEIFPIIAKFGATALLIEYDDMFPFQDNIEMLKSPLAYTLEEIRLIIESAENSNLKVIPLIQTFSHLEYVLKKDEFKDLREAEDYPTDICPMNPKTSLLLGNITEQILKMHPKVSRVHIGGDEVKHLGNCLRCKKEVNQKSSIYVHHIKNVAKMIINNHPDVAILIWDDFIRKIDTQELIQFNLPPYIQPVIWNYDKKMRNEITEDIIIKYRDVFGSIWFAGSFKGSITRNSYITKSDHHVSNIQSWLTIYRLYKNKIAINGIFLTGWQRFDHFSILCDLLPISIPSLGLTLTLLNGITTSYYNLPKEVNEILKCEEPHSVAYFGNGLAYCSYPGGKLLDTILQFHKYKYNYEVFMNNHAIVAWLNNYNIKRGMYNRKQLQKISNQINNYRRKLDTLTVDIKKEMKFIYRTEIVDEWYESYVEPIYIEIAKLINQVETLMNKTIWH
nr:hexosaminidase D-like [Onthophagus taurus]